MDNEKIKDMLIDEMHKTFGSGKSECAAKISNSRLPDKINTVAMLDIINRLFDGYK